MTPDPLSQMLTDKPDLLTLREAAEKLRISKTTMLRLVSGQMAGQPKMPSLRLGRRVLIHRETLEKFIRSFAGLDSAA